MLILFQPVCFSSSGSDHFNIRKINYQFFSTVFVSSVSKLPLFSRPPTLFLQGLRFLNHVSFYLWEVSSFFSFNVLIRWFPMKMLNSFKFIILRSFSSLVDPIQAFSVDHILFLGSSVFPARSPLASLSFRSVQDISGDSSVFQLIRGCHLIQIFQLFRCIIYLFNIPFQRCFLLVGPNPQVFSQDLTWLF